MILVGLILLLLGLFTVAKFLFYFGLVLLVAGAVLNFGPSDVRPRRRYW